MKSLKVVLRIVLALFIIGFSLERIYHLATDGFNVSRIVSDQYYIEGTLLPPPEGEELTFIQSALDQEYTYLAKGTQSFAFISTDGEFVLKFYKHHRHRRLEWLKNFSQFPLNYWFNKKTYNQKKHFQETFYSFKLGAEELKNETGLLYFHVGPSQFLYQTLTLVDRLGFKHALNLDEYDFILQKRADLLKPLIRKKMEEGDVEGVKEILTAVVSLLKSRCAKGIGDRDPGLTYNMGITKSGPIFLDLGQFFRAPELKDLSIAQTKIYDVTGTLRDWLQIEYPELEAHLKKEVNPS